MASMARSVVACSRVLTSNLQRRTRNLVKVEQPFFHSREVRRRAFAATSEGAVSTSSEDGKNTTEKDKEKEKSSGWGTTVAYVVGTFSGIYFFYHFYKSGYNLHKTEISLLASFRTLPLYSPPGDKLSEINSTLDSGGLSPELTLAFAEWFVTTDLLQVEGVTRDDVLELFRELGFEDNSKQCKRYLEKGEGMLEERRRLSGAALQESLSLLAELAFAPMPKVEEGAEPPVNPRDLVGPAAVELMRKKIRGGPSMSSNAAAMLQAMKTPDALIEQQIASLSTGTEMAAAIPSQGTDAITRPPSSVGIKQETSVTDSSVDDDDDSQQLELERVRLQRLEESLLTRLERQGSLSSAEESRLRDVRAQIAALPSK